MDSDFRKPGRRAFKALLLFMALLLGVGWLARRSLAAPAVATAPVRIGAIQWYSDYDQALAAAKREHKPLWIHFGENPG